MRVTALLPKEVGLFLVIIKKIFIIEQTFIH